MCSQKGLDIEFIGDGKLFVGNRNPDFIIPKTNKLVEIYSSSFRYNGALRDSEWVDKTTKFYAEHGYKCICLDLDKKDLDSIYQDFSKYYHNGLKVETIRHYTHKYSTF